MKFLDQAKIFIKSGDGGKGCISFRRENYVEFGGPNGGDGGRGGSVYVQAVDGLNTLIDYRYRQHFKAQSGAGGAGQEKHGAKGRDVILKVPVGTQVLSEDKTAILADMISVGQLVKLLEGGDGGRGNVHFKNSVNQAPRTAEPGWPGQEQWIWLRLKLIADVGLVGLPNAGKSTFLTKVSRANSKIANYPFTTLYPVLGVVYVDMQELVVADIPGLIAGASEGVGLGSRFLGHAERCKILLHIIDGASTNDIKSAYTIIRRELQKYGQDLEKKPEIILINKIDLLNKTSLNTIKCALHDITSAPVFCISGFTGENITEVLQHISKNVVQERENSIIQTSNIQKQRWQP